MAIVATFSADFSRWNEGLRDAQAKLGPVVIAAKGLQQQLERSAKSFSGSDISRQAQIAASAVKSIGGVAKLTADEQTKLAVTIDAALKKYQAMGQQVPPAIAAIADELRQQRAAAEQASSAFSGEKIKAEALKAIAAIEHIGDVSKLTASEQTQLSQTVSEAIEKYRVLGQAAPEALTRISSALKQQEGAAKSLVKIDEQAKKTAADLARLDDAFSGRQVQREAELAITAVNKIGGASKLTADELKRFSAVVDTAVDKAKRLGVDIPPAFRQAQKEIAAAGKGLKGFGDVGTSLSPIFSSLGATIAGAFAIGSVVRAAKAAIDYASNIRDLANRTGFATKAVQELSFAAGQSGVAFEAISTASFKLQKNLGDNNAGTVGALRKIGLSVEYIKSLKPEDAFTVVAGKLKDVTDQAERTKLGAQLMGKGFQDVSQLINDGLDENIAKAREFGVVLSDEQIGKLDALGDTWTALTTKGRVLIAEVLVPFGPALIAAADAAIGLAGPLREFPAYFEDAVKAGMRFSGVIKFLEADFLEFQQKTNPFAALAGTFDKEIAKLRTDARELGAAANALDFERAFGKVLEDRIKSNAAALKDFKGQLQNTGATADGFGAQLKAARAELAAYEKLKPGGLADLRKGIESTSFQMDELQASTGLSELALKLFTKQVNETNKALKESDAAKLTKEIDALTKDLMEAERAGLSTATVLEAHGTEIKKVVVAAAEGGRALPAMVDKWAGALNRSGIDKILEKLRKDTESLSQVHTGDFFKEMARQAEVGVRATDNAFQQLVRTHDAAQDAIDKRILTSKEYSLKQLAEQQQAEEAAIRLQANSPLRDQLLREVREKYKQLNDNIIHDGLIVVEQNRRQLLEQLRDTERTYRDMVESHQFTAKEIAAQQEELRLVVKAIQEKFGDDWKAVLTQMGIDWKRLGKELDTSFLDKLGAKIKGAFSNIASDAVSILADVLVNGAKLEDAAAALGTSVGGNLGGAIGFAIGGPLGESIGKTLGSLLGPLLKKLIKSDAERAAEELGREWGVTISGQMGEQIEETMKSKFRDMKNNRWLSEVFHLGDIIADVGGLTITNIDSLQKQLRQAFVFLDEGAFSVADTQEVLNNTFATFAEFYTSRNALISSSLQEIIKLDRQFGTESKAVADFVAAQADRAADGFNKIAKNFLTLVTGFRSGSSDMKDLLKAIDDALNDPKKRGAQAFAPEFLADVENQLARIGPLAEGAFGALLAGGASVVDAIAQLAPGLAQINDVLVATGQSATGFLGQVLGWQDIIDKNKELFEILSGVDDMLTGLHNSGLLTQDAFTSLADILSDGFTELIGQGESAADAIALMQPQLQRVWELQQDFGYAVDAATQALLDQATASGAVGDAHRSVESQMLTATNAIKDAVEGLAHIFGVVLPSDIAKTTAAAQQAGDGFVDAFQRGYDKSREFVDGLPTEVTIPIDFPTGDIAVPRHPTDITIPVDFETPKDIPIPRVPPDITIPVDVDVTGLDSLEAQLRAVGPVGEQALAAVNAALANLVAGAPGAGEQLHDAIQQAFAALPPDVQAELQRIHDEIELLVANGNDLILPLGGSFTTVGDEGVAAFSQIGTAIEGLPGHITIPIDIPTPDLDPIKEALLELGPTGEQAFDAIQQAMADLQAGVPGAVDELKAAFGLVWDTLPPEARDAFQQILAAAEAALGPDGIAGTIDDLPDSIEIPVDFPTGDITIPEHPSDVTIPVTFPAPGEIPIPRHPLDISIPVDFPLPDPGDAERNAGQIEQFYRHAWDEVRAGGVEASDEVRDAWLKGHLTIPDDISDQYTDCWIDVRDIGIEASDGVKDAWITSQSDAAGQIPGPFSDAWGTITSDGVAMSEDVSAAIRSIPDDMPEVRDQIIEALKRAGTVASGKDGIGRIGDALKDLPDLAREAASDIEDRLSDIDVDDIRIRYRYSLDGERPESISPLVESSRQQFASGTPGFSFQDFGVRTPVDLHGREAVVRYEDRGQAAAAWSTGATGDSGSHTTVNIYMNGSYQDRGDLIRDVRTAVVEGVAKNKDGSRNRMREALGVK